MPARRFLRKIDEGTPCKSIDSAGLTDPIFHHQQSAITLSMNENTPSRMAEHIMRIVIAALVLSPLDDQA